MSKTLTKMGMGRESSQLTTASRGIMKVKNLSYVSPTVVLMISLVAGTAFAQSLPSSKAVAAVGALYSLGPAAASANPDIMSATDDTGWATVMTLYIKTANEKELGFDMALQCGILTDTTVKSRGGKQETSQASGRISVRVKVTDESGYVRFAAPSEVDDSSPYNPDDPYYTGPAGVTYCSRVQTLSAKFAGLNCTADLTTGVVTCVDPEELRLILDTLNANAFNFLLPNVVTGVHEIEVQARAQASADIFGAEFGLANGEAFIGLGSLMVEEVRFIKDADGSIY